MARLMTSGFEIPTYISPFTAFTGTNAYSWETTGVRENSGAYWMKFLSGGSTYKNINYVLSEPDVTELYVRAAILGHSGVYSQYPCMQLRSASKVDAVRVFFGNEAPFQVFVNGVERITSALNGVGDTWYVVELYAKLHDTEGVVTLKVDGTVVGTWSGDTKNSSSDVGYIEADFGTIFAWASGWCGVDDVAINDTSGASHNAWLGDTRVIALHPNANGTNSGITGSDEDQVDNYLHVDEVTPDGDTSYVYGTTADQYELYNLDNPVPAGSSIVSVQPIAIAREETADGDTIKLGIKAGSTESWGDAKALLTSYGLIRGTLHYTNPDDSQAWEEADMAGLQAGIKIV